MKLRFSTTWHGVAIAVLACPTAALAGAVTDGSVGPVQSLSGHFTIPQTLGSVKGANLFHSFATFGVGRSESATFTTQSAAIARVISRVTGGQPSAIYGPLSLQAAAGAKPDFYFINPAGVIFGAGAQIDVPGGFHVGTAQQLKFADGFAWDTGSPTTSGLTVAAPEAFGFLGGNARTAIRFANLDADGNAGESPIFNLPAGSSLTIAAGDVEFSGTTLRLPAALVHVAATGADAIDLPIAPSSDNLATHLGGEIGLVDSNIVTSSPGILILRGNTIDLWRSQVAANNLDAPADTEAGGVILHASGELSIRDSGVSSGTNCDASGGYVVVDAGALVLDGPGTVLRTDTVGAGGKAGTIYVTVANDMTMSNGAQISSASANATGNAGAIWVTADSLKIGGQGASTGIRTIAGQGAGSAGGIVVDVANALTLESGGYISSMAFDAGNAGIVVIGARTLDLGGGSPAGSIPSITAVVSNSSLRSGDAGSVHIAVTDTMSVSHGYIGVKSEQSSGSAGALSIQAGTLVIGGAGTPSVIDSSAFNGKSDAGSIAIHVDNDLTVNGGIVASITSQAGNGGAITATVGGDLRLANGAGIVSLADRSSGKAGAITLTVDKNMSVDDGSIVSSQSSGAAGDAGDISIRADSLRLEGSAAGNYSLIESSTLNGPGNGGRIDIDVNRSLALDNGGLIGSITDNGGKGGAITIKAGEVDISGGPSLSSGIFVDAVSETGDAGNIFVDADRVSISRGGAISSSTSSAGKGGAVELQVGSMEVDGSGHPAGQTGIQSGSEGAGDAGFVDIRATGDVTLRRGAVITSNAESTGSAGSVTLQAGRLTMDGVDGTGVDTTGIFGSATATSSGQNGHVSVAADEVTLRNGATISIRNEATVADPNSLTPTRLTVSARNVRLDHSQITAAATGNANASNIDIAASGSLTLKSSGITTAAVDGNGGDIRIAGRVIRLSDSLVTTSVFGTANGNGGNIRIAGEALVLQSGFIQANTLAPLAQGGDIAIDTRLLLVDGGPLFFGGSAITSFRSGINVIQAAAPDGVAGELVVTTPELNLAGTLAALATPVVDLGPLARDQCRGGTESSFTFAGRGGLPASVADMAGLGR